jgi:hypothetical protein
MWQAGILSVAALHYVYGMKVAVSLVKQLPSYRTRSATSRTVPGSIPGGVTGDFFSVVPSDKTMCPEVDSASENE